MQEMSLLSGIIYSILFIVVLVGTFLLVKNGSKSFIGWFLGRQNKARREQGIKSANTNTHSAEQNKKLTTNS